MIDYPVLQSYGVVFNVSRAPFDDVRVRRAISLAIDRRRIVSVAVRGYGEPSSDAIPSTHPFGAASETPLRHRARRFAARGRRVASGADGVRRRGAHALSLELLTVGSSDNSAEQLIQSDLARIGVRVTIRQRELASFLAAARATPRSFDALYTGIPGDLSLSYLSAMFDSRFAGSALDYAGFHEPRLDSLLAAAREAPDTLGSGAMGCGGARAGRDDARGVGLSRARGAGRIAAVAGGDDGSSGRARDARVVVRAIHRDRYAGAVTILLNSSDLRSAPAHRRGALSPLAHSLRADMERVLTRGARYFGAEGDAHARRRPLSNRWRAAGVRSVLAARAPLPDLWRGADGRTHHRWWLMFAQLWRAERAVHAATLHALGDEPTLGAFARATLDEYADRYARYPLDDNVLGPSRPFFSTYLESIWLLQLCVAADLLDAAGAGQDVTGRFRDRVAAPSRRAHPPYDEGESNRQLWNNAALIAAGRALGDDALVAHAIHSSPSGLTTQLGTGLLADGSWYEGENYHLFSHRALWYGVTMAETAGHEIRGELLARFQAGFSTPFLTAFPDLRLSGATRLAVRRLASPVAHGGVVRAGTRARR